MTMYLPSATTAVLISPEPTNSSQVREHLSTGYELQHHVQVGVILNIQTRYSTSFISSMCAT